jgi:CubicO group peptidase (beta-lactamase class C family)
LSSCRPAQPDTIFQIGSVSKEFTAAAILQLQAAGQLNIDDKVQRYLPGYAFDPRLTLRMLLNQTSGLPDYVEFSRASSWVRGVAQADVLTAIVNANTLFAPGTAYAYSNSNYFVLAAIVEAVSKTTYADYLTRHIFQPVGLSHTSVAAPSGAQTASPYSLTHPAVAGTAGLAAGLVPDPSYLFGAADLWSNGEDLAKWNAALLGGAVISPDLLTQALTPPASIPVYQTGEATSYGMGWVRGSLAGHPLAWHNGKTYDYTAYNGAFLDDGVSLSILANVDLQEDTPFFGFAQNLMQSVCSGQGTATSC